MYVCYVLFNKYSINTQYTYVAVGGGRISGRARYNQQFAPLTPEPHTLQPQFCPHGNAALQTPPPYSTGGSIGRPPCMSNSHFVGFEDILTPRWGGVTAQFCE